ncbi:hypothetical protein SAMN05443287_102411 [Micromonospora phaseoli]|uniref:Uncharacterized protein n=1 Tax=Micromonospora phaseoli TaxID=1144548 RepID=A0A1H6V6C7_9ACTN|nr:hypothetical protein CLV64_109296 [Micromonospora phaseoli]SEI96200.1 hypothetical protein SAMN05443287_102411 [Micromonospora phaseoli]
MIVARTPGNWHSRPSPAMRTLTSMTLMFQRPRRFAAQGRARPDSALLDRSHSNRQDHAVRSVRKKVQWGNR